ncbi:hypothetical protein P1S61_40325 [Streptomyces sp. ME08-AFT2]|uniref:DUF6907 domain-containing protein n=1 Tax=Streptomyces sp. ME08-AFT2 TaxID=3028683 RepID=UPI0029BE1137|nr:hypothetical protein [Streptomyces sp. ME08-AFT2]MDX3315188.1 hypothetical protein [Streptomyces sp. ME08-AFT2]
MKLFPNSAGLMATRADIAAEHTAALDTLDFDKVIAALPAAIDHAMRNTVPDLYTAERAADLAAAMTAELRKPTPLTAAERGTEWMLRYGCTAWCINDHANPVSADFHSAGPAATELRTTDLEPGGDDQPWLTAETVVMNDKPQAYGRETRVLLGYGDHLAELTPDNARKALDAMRGFVAQLEAVVDQADASALDDFDGDPDIAAANRQAETARIKRITEASR